MGVILQTNHAVSVRSTHMYIIITEYTCGTCTGPHLSWWASASSVEWNISSSPRAPSLRCGQFLHFWCEKHCEKEATHLKKVLLHRWCFLMDRGQWRRMLVLTLLFPTWPMQMGARLTPQLFHLFGDPVQKKRPQVFQTMIFREWPIRAPFHHRKRRKAMYSEIRRLGYFSVAALIINQMIGGHFWTIALFVADSCTHRHWHFLNA